MGTYSYIPGPNPIGFDPTKDPGKAFANERARAAWEGDSLSQYYRSRLPGYIGDEERYRQNADQLYGDPGNFQYTPGEAGDITRTPELMGARLSPQDAEAAARWTPEEESAYTGNPDDAMKYLNVPWLTGISDANAANLRGAVSEGSSRIRGSIDPNRLRLDPNFASNYVMSPDDVEKISTLTGRQAGMQFTQEMDDLRRRAAAAGSTSPLAMSTQQERLRRLQAGQAAVSGLQGRLGAEDMRRGQIRDVEAMRLDAERAGTGLSLGAEENLLNQRLGAESEAGQMMERTGRYVTDVPMEQARYAEAQRSQRAGNVADVRRGARLYGQAEPYRRTIETGDRLSGRNEAVANQRIAGTQTRGAYQTGQQTYAGGRQSDLESGRVGAFGTTAGASQNAARGQLASRQPSWLNRNADWIKAGGKAAGAAFGVPIPFADGGVVTRPTNAMIGERGPEAVIPLDKLDKMKPKSSPIRLTINIASPATEGGGAPKKMRLAA